MNHPTGNSPSSVNVIALGPSKRDYMEAISTHHIQKPVKCDETWTLNTGFRAVPHDLLFVLDDMQYMSNLYPEYGEELKRHDKPIITTQAYDDFPTSVSYPLQDIISACGAENIYFRNSGPMIIAYAYAIGVKRLNLFGFDYGSPHTDQFEAGRENVEYWVGFARAKGMQVEIPNTSHLCAADKPQWVYGYASQPVFKTGDSVIAPTLPGTSHPGHQGA